MERDTAQSGIGTGDAFGVCPRTVVMAFADGPGPVQPNWKAISIVSAGGRIAELYGRSAMDRLQDKIERFRRRLRSLSDFEKWDWQEEFRLRFTHDSTGIEGSLLTVLDVKMILFDGIIPAGTKVADYEAVRGHDRAWTALREAAAAGLPLTEALIGDIHRLAAPLDTRGGSYRDRSVSIRGSQYVPPAAETISEAMKWWLSRIGDDAVLNPLEKAARIHGEFSKIQPFLSGNGPTARLMMNYPLVGAGYPPLSIQKAQQTEYFQALEAYELDDEIQPLRELLTECLEQRLAEFFSMYGRSY